MSAPGAKRDAADSPTWAEAPTCTDAAAADELRDASVQVLSFRYDILRELGRGGMGIVFQARDRETNEVVALKCLQPSIAREPQVLEQFKNELRLARQITHANVCRIHDFNREGDLAYITMEVVEGESLRALLHRFGSFSAACTIRVGRQICAALSEAHHLGIVHRDLKPENIILEPSGRVKVMDFGLAHSTTDAKTDRRISGTPAYMAPEQVEGKPPDPRSDIYAVGLVLFEMLTGCAVFSGTSSADVMRKHVAEAPRNPRDFEPTTPRQLEKVILTCLEKDAALRFQSVEELAAALDDPSFGAREPEVPAHLLHWRKIDSALLIVALLCGAYVLRFRETVFPASSMRMQVEPISARQKVQDAAVRVGRPFPGVEKTSVVFAPESYMDRVASRMFTGLKLTGTTSDLAGAGLPVYWRVEGTITTEERLGGRPTTRYALVDYTGNIREFVNSVQAAIPPNYVPAPLEQRRATALSAATAICGAVPAGASFADIPAGERGASYYADWFPAVPLGAGMISPANGRFANVELFKDAVSRVSCGDGYRPNGVVSDWRNLDAKVRVGFTPLFFAFVFLMVVIRFFTQRCFDAPYLWRRAPLAVAAGAACVWVIGYDILGSDASTVGLLLLVPVLALFLLMTFVGVEERLRQRAPALIASFAELLRGRVLRPGIAFGIIRGACIGIAFAAVETSLTHLIFKLRGVKFAYLFLADSSPVGTALASSQPALFTLASALLHGVLFGYFAGMGYGEGVRYDAKFREQKRPVARWFVLSFSSGAFFIFVWSLAHWHVFAWTGTSVIRFYVPGILLGMLIGSALVVTDLFTVMFAFATSVVWSLNYPLLGILSDVGNSGQWMVFAAWGAVVAAALVIVFREQLAAGWRRWLQQSSA